jgi:hypothetical protein
MRIHSRRHRALAGAGFCSLAALGTPPCARADFYLHHWENRYENPARTISLGADLAFYSTQSNFDANGTAVVPSGLSAYHRFQADLNACFGLTDRINLFGRLSWARVQVDHASRGGVSYGLTDQTVGASVRALEIGSNGGALDLQLQGDFPAYSNASSEARLLPYLGDQSTDVTAGAFATVPALVFASSRVLLVGGAGYTFRSAQFSSAVPWSVTAWYLPDSTGLFASVSGLGAYSLSTDPRGDVPAAPNASLGTGNSFASNAVDPSLASVRGQLGYRHSEETGITLSAERAVWGYNAPSGFQVALGLQHRISRAAGARDSSRLTPTQYGKSNRGFLNYGIEATVLKANDRLNLVRIDKGSAEGIEAGQLFDLFSVKPDGSPLEAVARARVTSVKQGEAALGILEYFREVLVDEGFKAKQVLK